MKLILAVLLAIFLIVLTPWLYIFHSSSISSRVENWSFFGSYIGGVTGPLLSLLSIIIVLHTFKETQKNHREQINLIINEQHYTKFIDLSKYLSETISKCWLGNNDNVEEFISKINKSTMDYIISSDSETPEVINHSIISAIYTNVRGAESIELNEVVLIINSLTQLIHSSEESDKKMMHQMVEARLTKKQRFILFYIMTFTHKHYSRELREKWPTFWNNLENEDIVSAS
ncbi:TPA: hypothetical protein JAN03_18510 [Citrobacter freundii]|nr:hypothetical protein [Citrobacter freundii]